MSVWADMLMVMKSKIFADTLKKGDYEVKAAREWTAFSSKDDWVLYNGEDIPGGAFLLKITGNFYSVVTLLDTDAGNATPITPFFQRVDASYGRQLSFIRANDRRNSPSDPRIVSFGAHYLDEDGNVVSYSPVIYYKRLRTDE